MASWSAITLPITMSRRLNRKRRPDPAGLCHLWRGTEEERFTEVDLGERELSEERTPLWPRGESVLCACLSQGQPLSVQYMPATFTCTRANTADRLTVVYRVSCKSRLDIGSLHVKSVMKSRRIAARWRLIR